MHQYIVGQGYWSYIKGAQENHPKLKDADYPKWEQVVSQVMYFLVTCVHDYIVGYIRGAETSKETWENLRKIFAAKTTTRKLQLHQELNSIQQRDMSITSYTMKMKDLCDSLGLISVNLEDDEMVQICLGGLAARFSAMRTVILARENPPSFSDLPSMLLVDKNHVLMKSNASKGHMLYSHSNGGEDVAMQEEADLAKHKAYEVRTMKTTPTFGKKTETIEECSEEGGDFMPIQVDEVTQSKCEYYGKIGHHEEECRKMKRESVSVSQQLNNYATKSDYDDHGGMFVMRHRANSVSASTSTSVSSPDDVCFRRLQCFKKYDILSRMVPRTSRAESTRLCRNRRQHYPSDLAHRQYPMWQRRPNTH